MEISMFFVVVLYVLAGLSFLLLASGLFGIYRYVRRGAGE